MREERLDRYAELVSVEYPDADNYYETIIREIDSVKGARTITLNRTSNQIQTELKTPAKLLNLERAIIYQHENI